VNNLLKNDAPCVPFLSQAATDFYDDILLPDYKVFEYGAGRSTIWLASRVGFLVVVEHCQEWHDAVENELYDSALTADLILVAFGKFDPGANEKVLEYVNTIDRFPDEFFDIVSCDGNDEARAQCIVAAVRKVKPGGWLIVDDLGWSPVDNGVAAAGIKDWPVEIRGGPTIGFDPENPAGPSSNTTGFYRKPIQ